MCVFQSLKALIRKQKPKTNIKGIMIALNPILEKLTCQKDTDKKKLASKAMFLSLNNSLVKRYNPKTVRIPNKEETIFNAQMLGPKRAKEKDNIQM